MRKTFYELLVFFVLPFTMGCGNSEKARQQFVRDSLRIDSIAKDSIAKVKKDSTLQDSLFWTKTSAVLIFHGLKGPVQKVTYNVNGKEGQDDPMQSFGYTISVLFDENGNLKGNTIVTPVNFTRGQAIGDNATTISKAKGSSDNTFYSNTSTKFNYECNDKGLVKKIKDGYATYSVRYADGSLSPKSIGEVGGAEISFNMTYKYLSFDEHGNWTTCHAEGGCDAFTTMTVKRDITYYPFKYKPKK